MSSLPTPDPAALRLSQTLEKKLQQAIAAQGSLSFSQFMHRALYEPGLGYYSAGLAKFGPEGDFITAPELSPLFGRCLARQIESIFSDLQEPDHPIILELGAGSGRLACDILQHLEQSNSLPKHYYILEVSADLRDRQQQLLADQVPHLLDRVNWLDALPEQAINGVILANEVLDALAVDRFMIDSDGIQECRVGYSDQQGFYFHQQAASDELLNSLPKRCEELPMGYLFEVNCRLQAWFAGLSEALQSGVILCIDYGDNEADYYHPQRRSGNLICHYRHHVHDDPFAYIGLQDLSASVNFSAVAEAADQQGLDVIAYTSQAFFLISCGLTELLENSANADSDEYLRYTQQVKILTLPAEMGERFKVIAFSKNYSQPLLGFQMDNSLERL